MCSRWRSSSATASLLRQVGEGERRPRGARRGDDRPVGRALVDDLARLLDARQPVAAGAHRIEAVEDARRNRAREADPRRAVLAQRQHPLAVPGRDEVERVVGGVLDPRPLDPRVEPLHVDELGAALVGGDGDRPHEPFLAGLSPHRDDLAGLHVGAEADHEVGEALQGRIVHGGRGYRAAGAKFHVPVL